MSVELWDHAVEIDVGNGDHFRSITNTRDALAFLMTNWPDRRGKIFAVARKACIDAIEGCGETSQAVEAFKAAAADAGILLQ